MKNKLIIGVMLYFILNILVTYLVCSSVLNPNIVAFNLKIVNEISAVIGNIAILLLLLVLGMFHDTGPLFPRWFYRPYTF